MNIRIDLKRFTLLIESLYCHHTLVYTHLGPCNPHPTDSRIAHRLHHPLCQKSILIASYSPFRHIDRLLPQYLILPRIFYSKEMKKPPAPIAIVNISVNNRPVLLGKAPGTGRKKGSCHYGG